MSVPGFLHGLSSMESSSMLKEEVKSLSLMEPSFNTEASLALVEDDGVFV